MKLQDAYYELRFELAFRAAKGDAFQTFFEKLMGLAYKADFMACRPWGNQGDKKNDGFLKSQKQLFQCYAPNEMTKAAASKKITEDFGGAKAHWGKHFDRWTFVHNAIDGLPPHVHEIIMQFEIDNPGIKLEPWCLEELLPIFRKLSLEDRQSWFGPVPDEATKLSLGFEDLRIVLETIATKPVMALSPVKDVPYGKIEANALSESISTLLRAGMSKAPLVGEFFTKWHAAQFGEKIAEAFRAKYRELRGTMSPNEIFVEIQKWAGGDGRGTAEHELAVLTVIAYYFDSCDIFEEPKDSK